MKMHLTNRNFYYVVAVDALLVAASYVLAYLLRYEGALPLYEWERISKALPYIIPIKLVCFSLFGLYRGMWRYTSLVDLKNILKAPSAASLILIAAVLFFQRFEGYSRSAFIMDWVLTIALIGGVRILIRLLLTGNIHAFHFFSRPNPDAKKLVIIGAGDAGALALREIQDNPELKLDPVGFLDDNRQKQDQSVHGVPVLGAVADAERLREEFDEILIAVPSAKGDQMRRIVEVCERT